MKEDSSPFLLQVDKVSILDHTIAYLRELERKVEELESYKEVIELESTTQSKPHDAIERTSDNYGPNKFGSIKKLLTNKRKACDTEKMAADNKRVHLRDSSTDRITVSITDKDVLIEMRCSWRESVLLEVMEAITKLHLDSQTVQSSTNDGILSMSIKAKVCYPLQDMILFPNLSNMQNLSYIYQFSFNLVETFQETVVILFITSLRTI